MESMKKVEQKDKSKLVESVESMKEKAQKSLGLGSHKRAKTQTTMLNSSVST